MEKRILDLKTYPVAPLSNAAATNSSSCWTLRKTSFGVVPLAFQFLRRADAIHFRHQDVEQHQIGLQARRRVHSGLTIADGGHNVEMGVEQECSLVPAFPRDRRPPEFVREIS